MSVHNISFVDHFMSQEHTVAEAEEEIKKYVNWSNDVGVIFDIGANVGVYSLLFHHYFPAASIYAFEPIKENSEVLVKNVGNNNVQNSIIVHEIGFWKIKTERDLHCRISQKEKRSGVIQDNTGRYTLFSGGIKKARASLEILDEWCARSDIYPDMIKIDVEGAEYDILSVSLKGLSSVRYLIVEFWNRIPGGLARLRDLIESNGFVEQENDIKSSHPDRFFVRSNE